MEKGSASLQGSYELFSIPDQANFSGIITLQRLKSTKDNDRTKVWPAAMKAKDKDTKGRAVT